MGSQLVATNQESAYSQVWKHSSTVAKPRMRQKMISKKYSVGPGEDQGASKQKIFGEIHQLEINLSIKKKPYKTKQI
jgi:hypothetical protein